MKEYGNQSNCLDCKYFMISTKTCDYILKHSRPCPPGKNCTVKETTAVKHEVRLQPLTIKPLPKDEYCKYINSRIKHGSNRF